MAKKILLCQNDILKLSCFGCCGREFRSKRAVIEGIKKNTLELLEHDSMASFAAREDYLRMCGICRQVVHKSEKSIVCASHPKQNNGRDLRDRLCDKGHLCITIKEFDSWSTPKKDAFIDFLRKKKLSHYEYSVGLNSNKLLEEFEKQHKKYWKEK